MSLYTIKPFTIDRYDDMLRAWKTTPGLGLSLSGADGRNGMIFRYFQSITKLIR